MNRKSGKARTRCWTLRSVLWSESLVREAQSELGTKGVLDGGGVVEVPSLGSLTAGVQFGIITTGKMMKRH